MEIIYKSTEQKSNFTYCSEIFKNKRPLNGFNKLLEPIQCECIDDNSFYCKNVFFENPIDGKLYIDYPLSVVVEADIHFSSLHELISEIRRVYKEIYKKEQNTLTSIIKRNKNLINRGFSDGLFGIWGHDISDLCISSIRLYEGNLIDVGIDS